jgi:hypothetical protein
MKKFSLLSLLLAYAATATAAPYEKKIESTKPQAQNLPPLVVLCDPDFTYRGYFSGLALQPSSNTLDYGVEANAFNYTADNAVISPSWTVPQVNPGFDFGFDLGFMGVFHTANSSLMVNWEHFHSSTDSDTSTVGGGSMIGPFFEVGPNGNTYKVATGNVWFHFDEVNLDYGTFVDFGPLLHVNLFAGVSFGRVKQQTNTRFSNVADTVVRTIEIPSSFTGAGPQLGFDFNYRIIKGFQLVGNTRSALLVGQFNNSTTFSTTSPNLPASNNPNTQTTNVSSKTGVVPAFEGKLGFAYEYVYRCRYPVKLEAGYQAQIYINSLRSVDVGNEILLNNDGLLTSSTAGVYARSFQRTVSDFGLAGPYATLSFAY